MQIVVRVKINFSFVKYALYNADELLSLFKLSFEKRINHANRQRSTYNDEEKLKYNINQYGKFILRMCIVCNMRKILDL